MTTKHVLFSLGNVNMVGEWTWQLELVPLRRGWFRAKTKCYSYEQPGTPGGSFKFRRGSELWEWLRSTWSETTLEILYPEHGIVIAEKLSEIEPVLGIDFLEASMRSWVARALDDYEIAPTRPSRVDSIMKRTKWLEPRSSGSAAAMQMGINMASARRSIKCFVGRGELVPTGDFNVCAWGRFRVEHDANERADEEIRYSRRGPATLLIAVTDPDGHSLPGYPREERVESVRRAVRYYGSWRKKALGEYAKCIAAGAGRSKRDTEQEPSCRLAIWVYEGHGPSRSEDPVGGAELVWLNDGSLAGELQSVSYDNGEQETREVDPIGF